MKSRAEQPLPRHGPESEVLDMESIERTVTERSEKLFRVFMEAAEGRMLELRGFGLRPEEREEIAGDFRREFPELVNEAG